MSIWTVYVKDLDQGSQENLAEMVGLDNSEMVVNFDLLGHCHWRCVDLECYVAVIPDMLSVCIHTVEIGWSYNKSRPN